MSASCSEVIFSLPPSSTSQAQPLAKWFTASSPSFVEQRIGAAELVLDHRGQLALWLLPLRRGQALPEEAVIPVLGGIVEELFVALLLGVPDHLGQRRIGKAGLAEQLVDLVDIGLVMLAVMEIERLGRHVRGERVLDERQVGKGEGHGAAFL